ncbi:MAG TPA: NAD(P)-dependent alcohol dehydrogenase [Xanthobacteraceae bacterium]|jgi:NADPH:quinone reductase-like Zn-dependent oxidoreductase
MKAVVYERYGPPDVLEMREIPKPMPKDNEVLIRIHATTVSSGDWRARSLAMPAGFGYLGRLVFGLFRPRQPILGTELAGEIEAVGKDVTKFKAGDQVFAFPGSRMGCYAEYRTLPEDGPIARKPANLTYEEAAALSFGGSTALDFFRRGKLQSGETVLVNGASGAVGTAAVQLAKHFGATVTGVTSAANFDLVKSIGADSVIDYKKEDFTRNGETYDVIVDTAGTAPFSRSKRSLKPKGRLLIVLGGFADAIKAPFVSLTGGKKVVAGPAAEKPEYLRLLAELAEAGRFKPVIDRRYSLGEIVAAHAYVDKGHKRGSVVVTVQP